MIKRKGRLWKGGERGEKISRIQRQRSAVQCSTVQYSTVQYSTVQYSTVQYSTVQYSDTQTGGQYLGQFTENAQNICPHYVRAFVR